MASFGSTLLILGGFFLSTIVAQINWCQVKQQYCNGQEHIACLPNSFPYSTTCKNVTVLAMNSTMKNLILSKHNANRQAIASGSNSKFPAAAKMGVMQWDDTLQYLAETHVAHCTFQHDKCRATPSYPNSGQNLYYMATALQYPNASRAIVQGIDAWFNEWSVANVSLVDNVTYDQYQAFHFGVMVNDKNSRIGCGLLKYNYVSGGWTFDAFMLTCNYQWTNMINTPTYVKGPKCSQCGTLGCSTTYNALCNS